MNTTLIHFSREGQPVGSWPAFMVPSLLERGDIQHADQWHLDGMASVEPVSELQLASPEEVAKVRVINFPAAVSAPPPWKFRSADVPFIDVVLVTFKVLLAMLIASPAVALIVAFSMAIAAGVGSRFLGH